MEQGSEKQERTSGHDRSAEPSAGIADPDLRAIALSRFFLYVLALNTFGFGLLNIFYFDFTALGFAELGAFLATCVAIADARMNRNTDRTAWVAIVAFGAFGFYLYLYTRAAYSVSIWIVLFPVVAFSILGTKRGLFAYTVFALSITGLVLTHRADWPALQAEATISNILGALIAAGALTYYQELSREKAQERVIHLARTDFLTGVLNRRYFVNEMHLARERLRQSDDVYSLLLIDIDNFKRINDTNGHVFGDEVIRTVCSRISAGVRGDDVVGRLGGEEFGVLLFGCGEANARQRADEIRRGIADSRITVGNRSARVTVSIGAATGHARQDGFSTLFAKSDELLYTAKAEGRDRVVAATLAPPDGAGGPPPGAGPPDRRRSPRP